MWWVLLFAGIAVAVAIWRAYRCWVEPWREMEQIIDDVANVRAPATFLLDGNARARRAALKLEDVFLRQCALSERASEDELNVRAILEAMPDGLCLVDESGRVRLLNPAVRKMFSIPEIAPRASVLETFRDSLVTALVENALRQRHYSREIMKVRGADESTREIAVTALPLAQGDGARGAVVLFEDITQLHQLEEVRRDFVSNVSHELRTPLSIFRGYLETLLDEPELAAEERERILRVLEKHSTRLNSLADDC